MRVCQVGDQQNTGPHLASSRLIQLIHWEDQRGKCKAFSIWSSHSLRKPVGGCPSSLHKEIAFCPLIPNGLLKDCPRCLLFLRVFSPSIETYSSVIHPRDVAFAPVSCIFPQGNPHSSRSRTPELKACKWCMCLRPGYPRAPGREVAQMVPRRPTRG